MLVLPKDDEVLAQTIEGREMVVVEMEKERVDEPLKDVRNLEGKH